MKHQYRAGNLFHQQHQYRGYAMRACYIAVQQTVYLTAVTGTPVGMYQQMFCTGMYDAAAFDQHPADTEQLARLSIETAHLAVEH